VLASKQAEAGQKFIDTQVATLKPVNNLQKILDAQAKRVAAAAPKKPAATEEKDGAAGTATPEGSTDAPAAEGGEAAPPAQE
jgi:peptidyl-prolyl cis-trans isomerase C